jgi:dihydropteroate synthase
MVMLRGRRFDAGEPAVMAIVNRTRDSFYDNGATFGADAALQRVRDVVAQGAQIVDIGAVKAGAGDPVSVQEEIERTAQFVTAVRAEFPDLVISVDTWRHEVGDAVCRAGADLLNDAWGGHDPQLAEVAAEHRVGLVCTHVGTMAPRTRPYRVRFDDVTADAVATTTALAERAAALGVPRESILIDPAHDFGKNTWHSLQLTRELDRLVATGWPVLVALSNKDFVGESLGGLPPDQRLPGTLAATAISAWLGACVFRAHNVPETLQVLQMVACIRGTRPPALAVRGLA